MSSKFNNKKIHVTKSFTPLINDYLKQVKRAFDQKWLTNRGTLTCELENKLENYLELKESKILCLSNGTIPLQIALKLLGDNGEIITTPFSYVATSAAIVWENCKPVFVDIDSDYLTIDETKIENAITKKTTCILATHVFGNPCNVHKIEKIAKKYNLKVIYDAAHCFGVNYNKKSLFEYGDISTCSFHATKLFHTAEGGAIFTKNQKLFNKIFYSHNFGHKGQIDFHGLGINGKMSELNAAMGLSVLTRMNEIISSRKSICDLYKSDISENRLKFLKLRSRTDWNYSYFPIILSSSKLRERVEKALISQDIYPRRYFYPSLDNLPYIKSQKMNISNEISSKILCLPLYYNLEEDVVRKIAVIINNITNRNNE